MGCYGPDSNEIAQMEAAKRKETEQKEKILKQKKYLNHLNSLIEFIFEKLNKKNPKVDISFKEKDFKKSVDELTRILCKTCRNMTKKEQDQIIYNGRNPVSRKLAVWWEDHKERDRKRDLKLKQLKAKKAKTQKEEQERLNLEKSALAKLSTKEKKALGIIK